MIDERLTTADDAVIAYRDTGPRSGRGVDADVPVILVHGMGGDGSTWDRFASALRRRGRRVVIPDLRGHGRSPHAASYLFADFGTDLEELIDRLGVDTVDLVGHSLGGHAATLVAQRRPSTVRRLVIEEAPVPIRPGDAAPTISAKLPSPVELLHAMTSIVRNPRAALAFDRSMMTGALTEFRTPNPQWWEALAHIEARVLVIVGGATGMVDRTRLEAMMGALADARVVAVDSGHSVHRDRYSAFEDAALPFLLGTASDA